ncbi:MAG TPA: hypothetical protein VHN74_17295 [Candidatus Angelobacter sp.]|jgi:hypothetical protein|nr:hypothetical protein [Candidatus Angelobacter sp.]
MANQKRVLGRIGARVLTPEDLQQVTGGINTSLCTFNPKACTYDGDCTPLPRCP